MWLANRVPVMAAQSTGMKRFSARGLTAWMARAISSLPVPLPPVIITLDGKGATPVMTARTCSAQSDRPTMAQRLRGVVAATVVLQFNHEAAPAALSRFPIRTRMPKLRRLLRGPINRPKTISLQAILELSPINCSSPASFRPIIAANKFERLVEVLTRSTCSRVGQGTDTTDRQRAGLAAGSSDVTRCRFAWADEQSPGVSAIGRFFRGDKQTVGSSSPSTTASRPMVLPAAVSTARSRTISKFVHVSRP